MVERLHGTVVPMLTKSIDQQIDWPLQVKFCLYAIRATPNRSTGFSPFQILYGREMRTPVDLWLEERLSAEGRGLKVTRWVEQLERRLDEVREQARVNGLLAQSDAKIQHDKKAISRVVSVGSLVLLRQPGLMGKLDSTWAGPYEIVRKVGEVTVEIKLPGTTKSRGKVVHINMTKPL